MRKYVHPSLSKNVPLTDSPHYDNEGNTIKDENGDIEYLSKDRSSLAEIIKRVKDLGIPESEYDNVLLYTAPPYSKASDWDLFCVYNKPKTAQQIDAEMAELDKIEQEKEMQKAERKKAREAKKLEKEKVLGSLTAEQKKALGIK